MKHVIFYDGDCILCNRFLRFVLKKDKAQILYFTSLQSEYARNTLLDKAAALDTIYYQSEGKVLSKSDAVFQIFNDINAYGTMVSILRYVPKRLRNLVYDMVANNRHRFFADSCQLADVELKERIV